MTTHCRVFRSIVMLIIGMSAIDQVGHAQELTDGEAGPGCPQPVPKSENSILQELRDRLESGKFGEKQVIAKLDHPALQELRTELKRVQASAEAWAAQTFEDPLEQSGPTRADQIPSLRVKREQRRYLAQRFLKEPLDWSNIAIKNGNMLSYFAQLLGPIALKQNRQLLQFQNLASRGDLSREDQERYELLKEVHDSATFPKELIRQIVLTRQISGQAQSFSFDKRNSHLSMEPMPLDDWPSQLLDRVYAEDRKRITDSRTALIEATRNLATRELATAEYSPDEDRLGAAFREWDQAGQTLMKSVDRLETTYRSQGLWKQRTLNHAQSDARRFMERLRHSAARLIAERNVETIAFSPQVLPENTREYSAMDFLAFLEGNGLRFGRAHAASEEAHRKLAIALRGYYTQIWSLQEVQRRTERELQQIEALVEEQQQHERTIMQLVAVAETAQAVAEIARTEREYDW